MSELLTTIQEGLMAWTAEHGLAIVLIIVGAYLVSHFGGAIIAKAIRTAIVPNNYISPEAEKKREDTLITILNNTMSVVVWIVAGMIILQEAGVEIGPLIAAAGIVGIALGFGGQYLIRDVISGLFIIMENQYRVGDVVCFGNTCGEVENITIRMTTLRDLDGNVHHMPHGNIDSVKNYSKEFARVHINIGVAYDSDLSHVEDVINGVGEELSNDPAWKDKIKDAPKMLRVNNFGDWAIEVKILGDTEPNEQWGVAGEFRRRLKIAFDKEGIEIPFPQQVNWDAEKKK